jgi:hypothetical protein
MTGIAERSQSDSRLDRVDKYFGELKMKKQKPMIAEVDGMDMESLPKIPFVGDKPIKGYREIDSLFVDSSGCGQRGEMALTIGQFLEKMKVGLFYGVTEVGQFQAHVGVFEKI